MTRSSTTINSSISQLDRIGADWTKVPCNSLPKVFWNVCYSQLAPRATYQSPMKICSSCTDKAMRQSAQPVIYRSRTRTSTPTVPSSCWSCLLQLRLSSRPACRPLRPIKDTSGMVQTKYGQEPSPCRLKVCHRSRLSKIRAAWAICQLNSTPTRL